MYKLIIAVLSSLCIAMMPTLSGIIISSDASSGGGDLLFAETSPVKGITDRLFGSQDAQPPDIELDDQLSGRKVYTGKVYISGRVTDAGNIETLTVNKAPVLRTTGRNIYFSHLAELREGKNIITIEAGDEAGNIAKKEITVTREDLPLSQLPKEIADKRMRIAVYPFEHNGTVSAKSGIFTDFLVLAFQGQNRFQLTDRAVMDRILQEQELSLTQMIDKDAAVNIGKLMSAQAIITGSIIETGGGIEMVGRMIDTETSEILATEKIYSDKEGTAALRFLAESMVVRFHNDFPMLRGIVVKRNGSHIFTSLGQDKAALNGRLVIYRGSSSGIVILGYARIMQVLEDMSKAEVISGRPDDIRELDLVIVQ